MKICKAGFILLLFFTNQAKTQQPVNKNAEVNFVYLSQYFNRHYALFDVKNIKDWDGTVKTYSTTITPQTTDSILFEKMSRLLSTLNDHHVNLMAGEWRFNAGLKKSKNDFNFQIIADHYLQNKAVERVLIPGPSGKIRSLYKTGNLQNNIIYLHISGFRRGKECLEILDSIFTNNQNALGLIIDIRNNGGGDDEVAKKTLEKIAVQGGNFLNIKWRYGNSHNDFTTVSPWFIVPDDNSKFFHPIALLTNANTASAAENFVLGMRTISNVTILGDTTLGIFATSLDGTLPNGWHFTCSNAVYTDQNGFCYEGKGIAPDLTILNSPIDLASGKDRALESAIQFLEGKLSIQKLRAAPSLPLKECISTYLRNQLKNDHNSLRQILVKSSKILAADFVHFYYDDYSIFMLFLESLSEKKENIFPFVAFMYDHVQNSLFTNFIKILYYILQNKEQKSEAIITKMQATGRDEEMFNQPGMVDRLANNFFNAGMEKNAFFLFNLNVRLHPENPNVYESLGDIFTKKENKTKAKKYYDQFLKLDPSNKRIQSKIKNLLSS